jgi:DNA repair exonuclease SbcCD ATPase subunit
MQGDVGSAPQTFKGTVALDEYGQRRIKSKKDDIEYSLNQLAKSVVGLMQYVYTSEKIIRLIQPNNKPLEVKINQNLYDDVSGHLIEKVNDISVGKYDIIVVSGSTLPSNRWARFEYYMQLFKSGLIDQIEVLKQTDVADMEGVLERAGQMQKLMQQVQQQEDQIKKLKGDLQTAQRESVHDRKRVEVKEFEKKLAKAEAKAEMATQLYKSRASDELSKLKEEVKEVTKSVDKQVGLKE